MKALIPLLAFAALLSFGCKHQYWTMVDSGGGETAAIVDQPLPEPEVTDPQPEPEPEVEPQAPKQIIFILGINGMD